MIRKGLLIVISSLVLICFLKGTTNTEEKELKNIEIMTCLYRQLENEGYNLAIVEKYFHPSYIQNENGIILDYKAFCQHALDVKDMTRKIVFLPFDQVIAKNNLVILRYTVKVTLKDGSQIGAPMVAIYELNDEGKIIRLWEAGVTSDMVKNSEYVKTQFTIK